MPAPTPNPCRFADALPSRRRNLISLTPLIDVVFILLIFFMLASSFTDWRAIGLAQSSAESDGEPLLGAVLVDVRPDSLRISGLPVGPAELRGRVGDHLDRAADRLFVVRTGEGVSLQRAVQVMDLISAEGAERISLSGLPGQ